MAFRRGCIGHRLPESMCVAVTAAFAMVTAGACGGGADKPAPGASAIGSTAPAGAHGPTVAGEPFGPRVIADQQQGGLLVGAVSVPVAWQFESRVVWDYAAYENPVTLSSTTRNPKNDEAVFGFANEQYFALRPPSPYLRLGQVSGGLVYAQPMAPFDTLAAFIRRTRSDVEQLQFVGGKDLPGLPAALQIPDSPGQRRGLGIKVSYLLNGKPVEEEFYAMYYVNDVPYDGPQGRTYQTYWGLLALHSFRAPAGTLDARRPIFAAIAKSFKPNPAWRERLAAINKYLADEFNRQLQAGYDQIAAAAAMSRAISANNDAMIASIDRQLQASRPPGSTNAGSSVDKFSDYLRGVETTDDPYYGTSQHSINEQFHWTDGYGAYRNTNDGTYDPNRSEVGNWTLLKNIR